VTRTWLLGGEVFLAVAILTGLSPAAENARAKTPDAAQIQRWITDLDHNDFATREAATRSLVQAGTTALPAVARAIRSGPPEASARAVQILVAWYAHGDPQGIEAVEDVCESLLVAGGTVGDQALLAWQAQSRDRDRRALEQLERLGARITFRDDVFGLDRGAPNGRQKLIQHIAIGAKWSGGDDGLKYIGRLEQPERMPLIVYRVNGNTVSDAAFQKLEDAGNRVEKRGAKLGVGNGGGFDRDPQEIPGFKIGSMEPGSAAERHGLMVDDIIVGFQDKPVTDFTDLVTYLLDTKPGDKVQLTVVRERMAKQIAVELGDWDAPPKPVTPP